MELLAGTRSRGERSRLRTRLIALPRLTVRGLDDFEAAAELYRACRGRGGTVRKLMDCLSTDRAVAPCVPSPLAEARAGSAVDSGDGARLDSAHPTEQRGGRP